MTRLGLVPAIVMLATAPVLFACASDPGERRPTLVATNVFVSPSGEPFHGQRDEPYAVAAWFAQADANHDGQLTRAEFLADAERAFHRYDTNGDGVIDGLELAAYEETIAPEILPRLSGLASGEGQDTSLFGGRGPRGGGEDRPQRRRGGRSGPSSQGATLYGLLPEPEPVSAADTDLDGRVTLAEWRAHTQHRFDQLADGRTVLTLADLPKTAMQTAWEARQTRAGGRGDPGGRP